MKKEKIAISNLNKTITGNKNSSISQDSPYAFVFGQPLFDRDIITVALRERIARDGKKTISGRGSKNHRLLYMVKGTHRMTVAGKKYLIKSGMIFYRAPKTPYIWEHLSKTSRYIEITIQPSPRWEALENSGVKLRKFDFMQQFYGLVEELILIKNSVNMDMRNSALGNANRIAEMLELERDSVAGDFPAENNLTKLIDRIHHHPEKPWRAGEMARELNVSVRTLNNLFHRHYNMTPCNLVIYHRIQKAINLLTYDTYTIKAIAEDCGYRDIKTFREMFRRRTWLRPVDFRTGKSPIRDPITKKWSIV